MITRSKHSVEVKCDSCGEFVIEDGVYGPDDFHFMWDEKKVEGWRAWKDGDTWKHKCPACMKPPLGELQRGIDF